MKKFFEVLPKQCPPQEAEEPNDMILHRIIDTSKPEDSDFWSQRKKWPKKNIRCDECHSRAVSLGTREYIEKQIKKFPYFKNKKFVAVKLNKSSGMIKTTFAEGHYSWWRSYSFNPLESLEL